MTVDIVAPPCPLGCPCDECVALRLEIVRARVAAGEFNEGWAPPDERQRFMRWMVRELRLLEAREEADAA